VIPSRSTLLQDRASKAIAESLPALNPLRKNEAPSTFREMPWENVIPDVAIAPASDRGEGPLPVQLHLALDADSRSLDSLLFRSGGC
jgi:hypothetical protein